MIYLLAKLEKNDCEEWKYVWVCFGVKEMKMSIMHGCVDSS